MVLLKLVDKFFPAYIFFSIFFIFVADNIILHFKFSLLYHRNKLNMLVSQINYNWTEPLFLFRLVQRVDIFHTMITDQPDVN